MNRQVAVKILSRKLSKNQAVLDRFLSQARTVAGLDHPNIIRAYNVDKADDRYYLSMEYVQGSDLEKIVAAKGPLRFGVAADFIAQAARGLHHGHRNNIVHEDVRPSNLLLDSDGTIKIDYLALTRIHEADRGSTVPSANNKIVNSIDCLAPECTGDDIIRPTADVYALGCTFYFLLTGKPPFPGGAPAQKLQRHQREQPESIRTFRSDVPEPLVEVCNKMMAKKPQERYQTCQAVAEALLPFAERKGESG